MVPAHSDLHIHLDQFDDPVQTAQDAADNGCALLCATTTPSGYLTARELLTGCPNVRVAAGLHPWWLDGRCGEQDIALLESLVSSERYIGEIGLDFLEKHAARSTWETQAEAFRRICAAAGSTGGRVLTIHSVRATATVLDILEETGCLSSCTCILHWFSDSADLLWRAIHAGCWFSMGARSLATGKGREYIKLIPRDRLLFETDLPWPGDAERGYAAIAESLARAEEAATGIIGAERVAQAQENASSLL
ncbi:MAG: TatD family hydrolase [Atopobiaceae bacterium]|nr:TatD family hydrolase [Atopobiaceae bacterium]